MSGFFPFLRSRFKLKTVLIVPFALQVLAIVGLAGYLSIRNSREAIDELATQLLGKTEKLVQQNLDSYLGLPQKLIALNLDAINRGQINLQDIKGSARYFWKQSQLFDQLGFVGYILSDNTTAGAGRKVRGGSIYLTLQETQQPNYYTYRADEQGNFKEIAESIYFNAAKEFWYTEAVRAGKPMWNQIFSIPETEEYISASANTPIIDRQGRTLGILSVYLFPSELSNFLKSIRLSPGSTIAIFERDGKLVASSAPQDVFFKHGNKLERWRIFDYPNATLSTIAQSLNKNKIDFYSLQARQQLKVAVAGEQYYVSLMPWKDKYGLDWLIAIVVPQSDFAQRIENSIETTIFVSLLALMLAILSGFFAARWIAKPILNLKEASYAIAIGEIEQKISSSRILELDSVGQAFADMAEQLKQSFADLEKSNQELEERVSERTSKLQDKNVELSTTLEALHRTQARVIQAEKMSALGKMVAGVAHEINNPVNFIHGNISHLNIYTRELLSLIELYKDSFREPPQAIQERIEEIDLDFVSQDILKIIDSMRTGAERICNIILSLRNFTRLDETGIKSVDIHQGLVNTLALVGHRLEATAKRAKIEVQKEFTELPAVECDAAQLNQVFLQLLNNAIDAIDEYYQQAEAARERIPKILLRTTLQDDCARIEICDNGKGIKEEVCQRIFDPFFTTKTVGKNTGLGLTTAYQIINELHKGELVCTSIPGGETCFLIKIPLIFSKID